MTTQSRKNRAPSGQPVTSARPGARIADAFLEEVMADEESLDVELLLATEPASPSASLRDRLLDTVRTTHRFDDLEARVAELADVSLDRARALLLDVDRENVWDEGPKPGIDIFHFEGGEKVANAITGFLRVSPGVAFPEHQHVGDESVLVLTGTLEDTLGNVYQPGELALMPAGSQHGFRAVGRTLLLIMSIIQGGVIIDGQLIPPGDPRA